MNNKEKKLTEYNKQLPDIFEELKEVQRRQVVSRIDVAKNSKNKKNIKKSHNYNSINYDEFQNIHTEKINKKFSAIGIIIGGLFVILFLTTVKSNYIFATTVDEEKKVIGNFESNNEPINLMEIASNNISEIVKKEITTEEFSIDKEIEYIEDSQLPKDEQVVIEEGTNGVKEITYIRSYEEDELIDEKIISENIKAEPTKSVIRLGTSKYLLDKKMHIGDTIYTLEEIKMMSEPKENSSQICTIYQYIDLKLEKVINNEWLKITVDGLEGYVNTELITSSLLTPDIVGKSRIKRIIISLNPEMEINKVSGLTRADFTKVLSENSNDVNKIFENNAGLFYDIEQKYNINGIFLASIGIHESNWGRSAIANQRKNLFGYGAYDSSPYESSYMFESYEYGIELLAKVLTKYYINEPGTAIYDGENAVGSYYNGPTVSGVNVRYASDTNWSNRVYEVMKSLYEKL